MQRHDIRRRLHEYVRSEGNWRLKGLLLALRDDVSSRAVGEAWPVDPDVRRSLQRQATGITPPTTATYSLAYRPDARESDLARSLYSSDERRDLLFGTGVDRDDYIARLLINESPTELDVLWREELLETIAEGAAARKSARAASTVAPVGAKRGDLPTKGTEPFASTGAEGGSPSFDEQDYYAVPYDCEKHEQGFALSEELIDQAEPDVLEAQIRDAGQAVENAINRQFINELLDNATNYDADLSGAGNNDVRDLLMKASEVAAGTDFDPTDTVMMHPEYASELFGNNQLASINGIRSDTGNEEVDNVVGHEPFVQSGTAYDSGTNTYGFENDGEHGALVYGRRFVHIPVYRDVRVSELSPPFTAIHDLQGGVASAWTDVVAADEDGDGTYESVVRVER